MASPLATSLTRAIPGRADGSRSGAGSATRPRTSTFRRRVASGDAMKSDASRRLAESILSSTS